MTSPDPGGLKFTAEQWAFLRRLNHDLRSPLMTILGTGEMLGDGIYGEVSPKQEKAIERLVRNSRRVQDLLTYAMTFMRLGAESLILNSAPVTVQDLINGAITDVKKRIGSKDLAIELVVVDGMPEMVTGDSDQLAMIIRELLINAVN